MLLSELRGLHYVISWDNPLPADSSSMHKALRKLGNISRVSIKTTVTLSPKASVRWRHVREAVKENLHPVKGRAVYVNTRTGKTFHIGRSTKWRWARLP
jgi:hypothetical protein